MLWFATLSPLSSSQQQPYTNSYWLNAGDYNGTWWSLTFDPQLGELGYDLGGHVSFARYAAANHPYAGIKDGILQSFFDPEALADLLADTPYPLPDPTFVPPDDPNDHGDISGDNYWFLGDTETLHWERYKINDAYVVIKWCPERLLQPSSRVMVIVPQTTGNGHKIAAVPGPPAPQPENPWASGGGTEPASVEIRAIQLGHYVAVVASNKAPDFWMNIQRAMDTVRFFGSDQWRPDITFSRVFTWGGSSEAAAAMRMPLLAPVWCNGTTNPFYVDMPFYLLQGGWQKLSMRLYSALGVPSVLVPVPPGVHSVSFVIFDEPLARGVETTGGWETGIYSAVMRRDEIRRPMRGLMGNCDIYFNVHWGLPWIKQSPMVQIDSLIFGTHGIADGPENQVYPTDDFELDRLLDDVNTMGPQLNPPVVPSDDVPDPFGDPYHVAVYGHTLLELPEPVHPQGSTFLSGPPEGEWVLSGGAAPEQFSGPYGTGIYPGAFDSMRAGNFDQDSASEVVFGNFDGFVEVLEEKDGSGGPVLVRQAQSPPLGYGISALDVGTLAPGGGTWIVCGTSQGKLYKIRINSDGTLGPPTKLQNVGGTDPREGPGFIHWLVIGNFAGSLPGNEVMVENERNVCVLFDATGNELARSTRTPNVSGPDGFTGACGKPLVCYWPPLQIPPSMVAYAPGLDGRLRRIYYEGANPQLHVEVVSPDLAAHGRCAWKWDPGSGGGPYVIVGSYRSGASDGRWILTMIDPETSTIIDRFGGYDGDSGFGDAVAIEDYAPNQILVAHGNKVNIVGLTVSPPGFDTAPPSGLTNWEQKIPGILGDEDFILMGEPIPGVKPEVCACETYSSGTAERICVSAPDGRLWLLDKATLAFARTTEGLDGVGAGEKADWYSNRSLGHRFTSDAFSADDDGPADTVWVDETGYVYYKPQGHDRGRIAGLKPYTGAIQDLVRETENANGSALMYLRGMEVDDTGAVPTPSYFLETGALGSCQGQRVKYALNSTQIPPFNGHIFEMIPNGFTGRRLENFDVPIDPIHADWDGKPWPVMNEGKYYRGEVTANQPLHNTRNFANAVAFAKLPVGGHDVDHVIVSTLGGFVYAVVPDDQSRYAGLNYYSRDLGWGLMGLAVGNIDLEESNEILVGSHVDTGGYADWFDPANPTVPKDLSRNRGQLVLLDPDAAVNGALQAQPIDISDPGDPVIAHGFGAGVCGIAIDDIDGVGRPEIWVTDSRGYLYVLWFDPNAQPQPAWRCFYRSASLGAYAGMYNKIYPFKSWNPSTARWETTRLVVLTPGYMYRFAVDPSQVPSGGV